MSSDAALAPEADRVEKEPAKRWRNWWRNSYSHRPGSRCRRCGRRNDTTPLMIWSTCCRTYPSRDVAETHAKRLQAERPETFGEAHYLGAYPDGETP